MEKFTVLFFVFFISIFIVVETHSSKTVYKKVVRLKRQSENRYNEMIKTAAHEYGKSIAEKHNTEIDWMDLTRANIDADETDARPVEQIMGKIKFETEKVKGEGRRDDGVVLYTNLFCNDQKRQNISAILSKTLNRTATFTWQLDESYAGLDVDLDLEVPGELNSVAEFATSANLKDKTKVEASTVDTFNVRDQVRIAPKTATKAIWILSERKMTVPFVIDLLIKGDMAFKFKKPVDGKNVQVYDIKKVLDLKPAKFSLNSEGELVIKIKGWFSGIRGLSANLRTKSHPLGNVQCKNSADLFIKKKA